ncbi:MAG: diguanylate cyclase [Thermodesulfobacteriota bacterium]
MHPEYDGRRMQVTMSFGVACFSGDLDATKNDLLSRADQAMYQAKQRGRNRCWSSISHIQTWTVPVTTCTGSLLHSWP